MKKPLIKLMNFLLLLHNKVLSGTIVQGILFIVIIYGFLSGHEKALIWLSLGLISYIVLMIKNHPKEGFSKIKKLYQKDGFLPFLTGFNYSLILGPITLLLDLLLIITAKEEKKNTE